MSEPIYLNSGYAEYVKDWSGGLDLYNGDGTSVTYTNDQLRALYEILQDRFSDEDDRSDDDDSSMEDHRPVQNFRDVERRLSGLQWQLNQLESDFGIVLEDSE